MCLCVYIHTYTEIFKLYWVISHLIGHFHLCIKVKFCSWCCISTWPKMWKWRGQDSLCSLVGLYMILTQWPGSSSEQSFCLPLSFTDFNLLHALLNCSLFHPEEILILLVMCIPKKAQCQVGWADTHLDAGVTQQSEAAQEVPCVVIVLHDLCHAHSSPAV